MSNDADARHAADRPEEAPGTYLAQDGRSYADTPENRQAFPPATDNVAGNDAVTDAGGDAAGGPANQ